MLWEEEDSKRNRRRLSLGNGESDGKGSMKTKGQYLKKRERKNRAADLGGSRRVSRCLLQKRCLVTWRRGSLSTTSGSWPPAQ